MIRSLIAAVAASFAVVLLWGHDYDGRFTLSPREKQFESLSAKALEILRFDVQSVSLSAPPWPANVAWLQNQQAGALELAKRVDSSRRQADPHALVECSIILNEDTTILLISKGVDDELLTYSAIFFYDGENSLVRVGIVRSSDVKPRDSPPR